MKQGRRPLLQGLVQTAANRTYGPARQILNLNRAAVRATVLVTPVQQPAPAPTPPGNFNPLFRAIDPSAEGSMAKFAGTWQGVAVPDYFNAGGGYRRVRFFQKLGASHWVASNEVGVGLYRSDDGGVTWAEKLTDNVGDLVAGVSVARAVDGTLWAIGIDPGSGDYGTYSSADNGDTWVLSVDFETLIGAGDNGRHIRSIDCSPVDANIIVAFGSISGFFDQVVVSTDGGGTWSAFSLSGDEVAAHLDDTRMLVRFTPSGRVIVTMTYAPMAGNVWRVFYSDTPDSSGAYVPVDLVGPLSDALGLYVMLAEGASVMFAQNNLEDGTNEVFMSSDGATWDQLPAPFTGSLHQCTAIWYDAVAQRLWASLQIGTAPDPATAFISSMDNPSPSGTWVDRTSNLLAVMGAGGGASNSDTGGLTAV